MGDCLIEATRISRTQIFAAENTERNRFFRFGVRNLGFIRNGEGMPQESQCLVGRSDICGVGQNTNGFKSSCYMDFGRNTLERWASFIDYYRKETFLFEQLRISIKEYGWMDGSIDPIHFCRHDSPLWAAELVPTFGRGRVTAALYTRLVLLSSHLVGQMLLMNEEMLEECVEWKF